ncbi:MAG TPA: agmatinase family protein [Thermomicrobiales bacterium]|nr:agmatinase family protein [Thermomicrobiales bacterium]
MSEDNDRIRREDLVGSQAMAREDLLDQPPDKERQELLLAHGLQSSESIRDRTIPLFSRGKWRYNSGTFMNHPYLEDMRELGGQDVVILGAPYDGGATFRPGTRFGPQAMRRISSLTRGYNPTMGVDLDEQLTIVDAGDISVIPSNLEKTFDQIAKAVSYAAEREVFPIVLGGDHAIGYPDVRGLAPYIDGNIGIIHFDRHSDLSEYALDERMHGSPFFHATNIPNAPATNLVQIGIGGWTSSRDGMKIARDRQATVITMSDVDRYGVNRVIEYALEIAWKNAKAVWISFDVDSVDPAFAPGTGTPVPGGFLPREVLAMIGGIAREGLAGMEVVEVSPPYDVSDITALLGVHAILDCLGALVQAGKLGRPIQRRAAPDDGARSSSTERLK